ncbi:ATP-dependent DNA helicase [Candidatus Bilamarchaeum dharawalense]|uniref:ATP-dependent DNA helicase n=1 Tax=Candidatus Bilamarchaeum dharawalense TaxID=2885759 RepID=A0A5E4LWX2_9ARCH|nr:ATP-dependent DNA helicase [Candidatus Bilamarchaeum dharawalense]
MALYFRHDHVRASQKELMEDIHGALAAGQNFMAQAPTGLGKTDASISAALSYALENDLTVFFLTPKISQHKIALDVVNGIAKKHSLPVRGVDLLGRVHCCIDPSLSELDNDGFQTACIKKRKDKTCPFYTNSHGYGKLEQAKADFSFKKILATYGSGKSHHELIQAGRDSACCPYEWLIKLASISNVIIADYYHLLVPHISVPFLSKIKKSVDKSIVILDEAHNLSSRMRSSMSKNLSSFSFARAAKEMRYLKLDPEDLEQKFNSWAAGMLGGSKERTITSDDFLPVIETFGLTPEEAAVKLEEIGLEIILHSGKKSACLRLGHFISDWTVGDKNCVRILKTNGEHFFLSKKMLDPSPFTSLLNDFSSSILMSGTLLPLSMHRDVLGLDPSRTIMKTYTSPFAKENSVNIITKNITTKYSKRGTEGYLRIAKKIDAIVAKTPGGTAVFFPSYKVMDEVLPYLFSQNLHIQKPEMKPPEIRQLIKNFKNGGVLCGVQGGSLSEGVDYCEGEIKTIIVVGVALDEMGLEIQALIDYYDEKFGRGWDYGYLFPGTLKALQAAGRALRKETDRVAIVYMDERFNWPKYNAIFEPGTKFLLTQEPERAVNEFWRKV